MPRKASWLPRVPDIRKSVRESVRSHYERRDLERLFHLQPRAAQQLMRAIAVSARVGRSSLVARETLLAFLDHLAESPNPTAALLENRRDPQPVSRRKLRDLVQVDEVKPTLDSLPINVVPALGQLTIKFRTMKDLADGLVAIAEVLDEQLEEFAEKYEPASQPRIDPDKEEIDRLFRELEQMEAAKATCLGLPQ